MFEGVGRSRDQDATRRSAQSLVLTSLLGFTATCVVGGVLVWQAAGPVDVPVEADLSDPIEYVVEVKEPELEVPKPPAPRKIARGSELDKDERTPQPEPDEPAEPEPLDDEVKDEAVNSGGSAEGIDDGDPQGTVDGTATGTGDACLPGQDCSGAQDGPVAMHHSEVQVLRRVAPDYPQMARALGLDETQCKALVIIDERGRPESVRVQDCPSEFHAETERALMRWKFRPARVDGAPVRAQFLLGVRYKLR